MTVYGLLSTIFICATVIGVVLLLQWKPVKTEHIETTDCCIPESELPKKQPIGFAPAETEEQIDTAEPQEVAASSMDAVIAAANRLMGIEVEMNEEDTDARN